MSEKLSRLKAIRGGHRSVVTKHEKEATTIITDEIITKDDVSRIQVIQCLLEEKLKTLNTIDQDVLTLCSEAEIEKEIEDSEAIVARIMGVNNAIAERIKQYEQPSQVVTGSQRSYITNELKEKLDLKPIKQETLHLNTFGEEGFKRQKCDMFSLQLQGEDGELDIELSALAFPVICSPVSTRINIQEFPHLDGLQFADNLDGENQPIDMLLGADYYYKIVTGEVIKSDTGPTAVG
ncbi:Hypothetical predicted protein, partial [Paramuricea clavata]